MLRSLFSIYGANTQSLAPGRPQPTAAQHVGAGVAIVSLTGTLSRDGLHGGSSTDAVRAELKTLAADPSVRKIILRVNSPGGASAGTASLHDEVVATAKLKPVVAFVEDLAASAAYFAIAGVIKIVAKGAFRLGWNLSRQYVSCALPEISFGNIEPHRRHLSETQRSVCAAKTRDWHDKQAKKRQKRKPANSVSDTRHKRKQDASKARDQKKQAKIIEQGPAAVKEAAKPPKHTLERILSCQPRQRFVLSRQSRCMAWR